MKIAYFTTAQDDEEYKVFSLEQNPNANSSNQVFHSKLIDCLSLSNEISVYSCRFDGKDHDYKSKKLTKICWNYLKTKSGKCSNLISQISDSKKIKDEFSIAFVDTMNIRCLFTAKSFAKKNKIPLIGIVTDNPNNITNSSNLINTLLLKTAKKCDGFICLTESLNKLFNTLNKPYVVIKGLARKLTPKDKPQISSPYFFYAGTLLKKYGIYDLLQAIKHVEAKLVIAGHHADEEFNNVIKDDTKVIYLGNIENKLVHQYENNAVANINPRPYMQEIDKYSIPSKLIEYSSKNALVISCPCKQLENDFNSSILWTNDKSSLIDRMNESLYMKKDVREEKIKEMNYISEKNFSLKSINKIVEEFISKFSK